ncbi:MAG: carboxylating nicotinate-nucleotide diphosphorylase [Actinomycetota bacterium]|nr:carboxylating nicotinate-nucleotide diphosphorylase [Actinomycetota bacterium]
MSAEGFVSDLGVRDDVDPPLGAVREIVARALAEDILPVGDLTASLVPIERKATAAIKAREPGVLAGRLCAIETFAQVDPEITSKWRVTDGARLAAGDEVGVVSGRLRSLLTAERTALNFMCHLSGVATLANRFVEAATGSDGTREVRILDTRKTTPGLRALEKAAVRAGGGFNHRGSLSEAVLVKDNHRGGLTIAEAVATAQSRWPGRMVEVECDTPEQVDEALRAGATMILLDNMLPAEASHCVRLARSYSSGTQGAGRVILEASGRVTLDTVALYAGAGVDAISVGALTHSAPALDLGLDIDVSGKAPGSKR